MAEVRMSLEEYLQLVEEDASIFPKSKRESKKKAPRKGVSDPKMSRALVKANKMGKKKAGGFKKGWNQSKIMSKAHQLRRKM